MQLYDEPAPEPEGEMLEDREIPSSLALVSPLVFRLVQRLQSEDLIDESASMKIKLCFDEAITNGVKHGNKLDFEKTVRVRLFKDSEGGWGILIQDQGSGFAIENTPFARESIEEDDALWRENGRGLPLIDTYMDEADYYDGGRSCLMRMHTRVGA